MLFLPVSTASIRRGTGSTLEEASHLLSVINSLVSPQKAVFLLSSPPLDAFSPTLPVLAQERYEFSYSSIVLHCL